MIPVHQPLLGEQESANLRDCIDSGWISSSGGYIDAFEAGWAAYCGRRHGIAMSNGSAALQAAVAALDLQPGDEVILPTFTIISCALAVLRSGARPVLVDCDPETWTMDTGQVAERITARTRAIMPVHIYGHPVDMDPILDLAARHGLAVIEDAAEAHGAEYRHRDGGWRRCGGFGEMSAFSFYANKIVTTGEGGMVLTDDAGLAARLRGLRNLCFGTERRFEHAGEGFNFRMTNLQAAVGVAQLRRIDETLVRKRALAEAYATRLTGIDGLTLPTERPWARNVYWMYGVVLDRGLDATAFAERLAAGGVETRPFFLGMHEQPVFQKRGLFAGEIYPVAERLSRRGLYLPSGPALDASQFDHVAAAVKESLE